MRIPVFAQLTVHMDNRDVVHQQVSAFVECFAVGMLQSCQKKMLQRPIIIEGNYRELVLTEFFKRCVEFTEKILIPISTARGLKECVFRFVWDQAIRNCELSYGDEIGPTLKKCVNRRLTRLSKRFTEFEENIHWYFGSFVQETSSRRVLGERVANLLF